MSSYPMITPHSKKYAETFAVVQLIGTFSFGIGHTGLIRFSSYSLVCNFG